MKTSAVFALLVFLSACLVASPTEAQAPGAHWSKTVLSGSGPPLRRENPGTDDGANYMYVFGGKSGSSLGGVMNDLWRFDGSTWTMMTADGAVGSPSQRFRSGVTWDIGRNRLVVFGGIDAVGTLLNDTWEWDPTTNLWSDVTPVTGSPAIRQYGSLAFDHVNFKVLMFGGEGVGAVHYNDSWHFDGTSWTQLSPAGAIPTARRQHVLVTRPDFFDVILAGGQDPSGGGMKSDTWQWDGSMWNQVPITTPPAGKVAMDAAYDAARQRIVIASGNPGPTGIISEFDAFLNDWVIRPLDTGIFKVTRYFMAYIPAQEKVYKVSGQALNMATPPQDTYEMQSDFQASYTFSGTACSSTALTPEIFVTSLPWIGRTIDYGVKNVTANQVVTMMTGFDKFTYMGAPLPLDLTPFGLTGCTLYLNPGQTWDLGPGPIPNTVSYVIPDIPGLYGYTFYNQAVLYDVQSGLYSFTDLATGVIGVL